MPVAWNTRHSRPAASSAPRTAFTQGVVSAEHAVRAMVAFTRVLLGIGRGSHAGDGARGIAQDPAQHAVEAADVHHRGHQHQIGAADVWTGVAAGDGGDQQLREAHRQRAQGRCDQGGPAGSAQADGAGDPAGPGFGREERTERLAHGRDCRAAIAAPQGCSSALGPRMACRDLLTGDIAGASSAGAGADIDHPHGAAEGLDATGQEGQLGALGVEGGDGQDRRGGSGGGHARGSACRVPSWDASEGPEACIQRVRHVSSVYL